MADSKMSTIVMMVDLECDRCYKKIRRVLCKLQDKASIKAISYDEKKNTVTVAGPFDADEVSDRLCSSAGKVITDIRVVSGKPMPGGAAKAHANKPGKDGGGGGGGGGGGKPEIIKKHVKFEMADDIDDGHHHHHHDNRKPKVVTTNHAAAAAAAAGGALSRMEGRRAEPNMAMAAAMAPVPMPMTVQATATPSIWPAPAPAPLEWGHSTPTYGAGWAPPPSGGYYGGGGPMYYGQPAPAAYGYGGRNPYQPQYYDEEPAGCSVM